MEQDVIIKLCIVGEPGVGKTSMLYQYVFKKFDQNTRPTIGCDFSTKLKSTIDGKTIRLQLWDIAGQERFNAVSKMYIRGAFGRIYVRVRLHHRLLK
jgi:small GTP-binding protein